MSNPKRMGSTEVNAAEILQANCSCGDGNWKDHAIQCIPPKTAAMQMGKEIRMTKIASRSQSCGPMESKWCHCLLKLAKMPRENRG